MREILDFHFDGLMSPALFHFICDANCKEKGNAGNGEVLRWLSDRMSHIIRRSIMSKKIDVCITHLRSIEKSAYIHDTLFKTSCHAFAKLQETIERLPKRGKLMHEFIGIQPGSLFDREFQNMMVHNTDKSSVIEELIYKNFVHCMNQNKSVLAFPLFMDLGTHSHSISFYISKHKKDEFVLCIYNSGLGIGNQFHPQHESGRNLNLLISRVLIASETEVIKAICIILMIYYLPFFDVPDLYRILTAKLSRAYAMNVDETNCYFEPQISGSCTFWSTFYAMVDNLKMDKTAIETELLRIVSDEFFSNSNSVMMHDRHIINGFESLIMCFQARLSRAGILNSFTTQINEFIANYSLFEAKSQNLKASSFSSSSLLPLQTALIRGSEFHSSKPVPVKLSDLLSDSYNDNFRDQSVKILYNYHYIMHFTNSVSKVKNDNRRVIFTCMSLLSDLVGEWTKDDVDRVAYLVTCIRARLMSYILVLDYYSSQPLWTPMEQEEESGTWHKSKTVFFNIQDDEFIRSNKHIIKQYQWFWTAARYGMNFDQGENEDMDVKVAELLNEWNSKQLGFQTHQNAIEAMYTNLVNFETGKSATVPQGYMFHLIMNRLGDPNTNTKNRSFYTDITNENREFLHIVSGTISIVDLMPKFVPLDAYRFLLPFWLLTKMQIGKKGGRSLHEFVEDWLINTVPTTDNSKIITTSRTSYAIYAHQQLVDRALEDWPMYHCVDLNTVLVDRMLDSHFSAGDNILLNMPNISPFPGTGWPLNPNVFDVEDAKDTPEQISEKNPREIDLGLTLTKLSTPQFQAISDRVLLYLTCIFCAKNVFDAKLLRDEISRREKNINIVGAKLLYLIHPTKGKDEKLDDDLIDCFYELWKSAKTDLLHQVCCNVFFVNYFSRGGQIQHIDLLMSLVKRSDLIDAVRSTISQPRAKVELKSGEIHVMGKKYALLASTIPTNESMTASLSTKATIDLFMATHLLDMTSNRLINIPNNHETDEFILRSFQKSNLTFSDKFQVIKWIHAVTTHFASKSLGGLPFYYTLSKNSGLDDNGDENYNILLKHNNHSFLRCESPNNDNNNVWSIADYFDESCRYRCLEKNLTYCAFEVEGFMLTSDNQLMTPDHIYDIHTDKSDQRYHAWSPFTTSCILTRKLNNQPLFYLFLRDPRMYEDYIKLIGTPWVEIHDDFFQRHFESGSYVIIPISDNGSHLMLEDEKQALILLMSCVLYQECRILKRCFSQIIHLLRYQSHKIFVPDSVSEKGDVIENLLKIGFNNPFSSFFEIHWNNSHASTRGQASYNQTPVVDVSKVTDWTSLPMTQENKDMQEFQKMLDNSADKLQYKKIETTTKKVRGIKKHNLLQPVKNFLLRKSHFPEAFVFDSKMDSKMPIISDNFTKHCFDKMSSVFKVLDSALTHAKRAQPNISSTQLQSHTNLWISQNSTICNGLNLNKQVEQQLGAINELQKEMNELEIQIALTLRQRPTERLIHVLSDTTSTKIVVNRLMNVPDMVFYSIVLRTIISTLQQVKDFFKDKTSSYGDCQTFAQIIKRLDDSQYVFKRGRSLLMFEYLFGNLVRKEQLQFAESLVTKSSSSGYPIHFDELLMGKGKTTVILPLLALLKQSALSLDHSTTFIVVPVHMMQETASKLAKYVPLESSLFKLVESTRQNPCKNANQLKFDPLYFTGFKHQILLMTDQECKRLHINREYTKDFLDDVRPDYALMGQCPLIVDEFDSVYDPSTSILQYPIGDISLAQTGISTKLWNDIAQFMFNNIQPKFGEGYDKNLIANIVQCIDKVRTNFKFHANYGQSKKNPLQLETVPFSHADKPIEGSNFADTLLQIILTLEMHRLMDIGDLHAHHVIEFLQIYSNETKEIVAQALHSLSIPMTIEEYAQLMQLSQKTKKDKLKSILQSKLNSKTLQDGFRLAFIIHIVLPKMGEVGFTICTSFLESLAQFHDVSAFSGTSNIVLPDMSETKYSQMEVYKMRTAAPDENKGAVLYALTVTSPTSIVWFSGSSALENLIQQDFDAFMDAGAFLLGTNMSALCLELCKRKKRDVVFFGDNDMKFIVSPLNQSPRPFREATLPHGAIIIYDHAHCIGADIKQYVPMRGIVSIDPKESKFAFVSQAVYRLRQINFGHNVVMTTQNQMLQSETLCQKLLESDTQFATVDQEFHRLQQNMYLLTKASLFRPKFNFQRYLQKNPAMLNPEIAHAKYQLQCPFAERMPTWFQNIFVNFINKEHKHISAQISTSVSTSRTTQTSLFEPTGLPSNECSDGQLDSKTREITDQKWHITFPPAKNLNLNVFRVNDATTTEFAAPWFYEELEASEELKLPQEYIVQNSMWGLKQQFSHTDMPDAPIILKWLTGVRLTLMEQIKLYHEFLSNGSNFNDVKTVVECFETSRNSRFTDLVKLQIVFQCRTWIEFMEFIQSRPNMPSLFFRDLEDTLISQHILSLCVNLTRYL